MTTLDEYVTDWWRTALTDASANIAQLAKHLTDDLLQHPEWVREIVFDLAMSTGRANVPRQSRVKLKADAIVSVLELEESKPIPVDDHPDWVWTDTKGNRISLLDLTGPEAVRVAAQRERAGVQNFRLAGLLKIAADRLTNGERIRDKWTIDELAYWESRIDVAYPLSLKEAKPWKPSSLPSSASSMTPTSSPVTE